MEEEFRLVRFSPANAGQKVNTVKHGTWWRLLRIEEPLEVKEGEGGTCLYVVQSQDKSCTMKVKFANIHEIVTPNAEWRAVYEKGVK